MDKGKRLRPTERGEHRVDGALNETVPASDATYIIGAGAPQPGDDKTGGPRKAAELAGDILDQRADLSASSEEQARRRRRLLKGPKEFREMRRDHPHGKC